MPPLVLPNPSAQRRRRNSWIAIGLLLAIFLPLLSLWLLVATNGFAALRPMTVRIPTPTDRVPARFLYAGDEKLTGRVIAVAEGPIAYGHPLSARLYLVQDGVVTDGGSAMSGRSVEPSPRYRLLRIVFSLGEATVDNRRLTVLQARGGSRSGGWGEIRHGINSRFRQTFPGKLEEEETCLLYVEGDHKFVALPDMTVGQFAKTNDGSFLVVTVTRQ